ncbi:MAG: F0F1 ATP synthase subunit delta [Lactovum sp.]
MSEMISKKYGKALLELAQKQDKLSDIMTEAANLNEIIKTSGLTSFFSKEIYHPKEKEQIFLMLEKESSTLMSSFLRTVKENGRLAFLENIFLELKRQADDQMNVSDVEVITSVELTAHQEEKIMTIIKEKFSIQDVTLIKIIDEKILGGFIIKNRGKIIDVSIKSQLAKIAAEIL